MNINIIKNNKLIALFMGGITSEMNNRIVQGYQNIWLPFYGLCNWCTIELGNGQILKYHENWAWLMPVVEKIESLNICSVVIDNRIGCQITHYDGEFDILYGAKKIEAVYSAVITFIKWYNDEQQN